MRTYAPRHVKGVHSSIIHNIPKVNITEMACINSA